MLSELRSSIRGVVELYCNESPLSDNMLKALSGTGFALHPEARCTAGIITLKVYEAICSELTKPAFKAAVAVELYMEAAFIFDNVADQDMDTSQGMSASEWLAIAIGLMACGGRAVLEAGDQDGNSNRGLLLLNQLQKDCLSGCCGQFLDASLQRRDVVSTDEALEMTRLKSGSLGRSAAALGAIIATDDSEIIDLFGEFGFNLFTYLQLIDDLRDACPDEGHIRDLEQHKKTLPLAYFVRYMSKERNDAYCDIIPSLHDGPSSQKIRREYEASGASVFCAIVAETFLNQAKSNLAVLKDRVRTVESLEQFINSLEISPDEVFAIA